MKVLMSVGLVLALGGCAAGTQRSPFDDLRNERNLRTERTVYLTFPQIQQALFKHQAACGVSYTFALEPRQTSYATVVYQPGPDSPDEAAMLVEMAWYQGSWRTEERVKMKIYTAYGNSAVADRIDAFLAALAKPEQCHKPEQAS